MKLSPAHQSLMLFQNGAFVCLVIVDYLPLFFQHFYHTSLLLFLNLEDLRQRHQIFILVLGEIDLKAGQLDIQNLFLYFFEDLVVDLKVHIIDE